MKRLKHKETGMIYRWSPVLARMGCMEEVDIPLPDAVKLPARDPDPEPEPDMMEMEAPAVEIPEVSLEDLDFIELQEAGNGKLSD